MSSSRADYSPQNVAPLIESFAGLLHRSHLDLIFRYDMFPGHLDVKHPGDRLYLASYLASLPSPSAELERYEMFAKKSARLTAFAEANNIVYFQ